MKKLFFIFIFISNFLFSQTAILDTNTILIGDQINLNISVEFGEKRWVIRDLQHGISVSWNSLINISDLKRKLGVVPKVKTKARSPKAKRSLKRDHNAEFLVSRK